MKQKDLPVGFLDSGIGGLSVLKEAVKLLPNEDFLYYGDSKNAPYGTKTRKEVQMLTGDIVGFLRERGVKAIVIACNTATSAAASLLREKFNDMPIVGIEPALKPAVIHHIKERVLVMATPMTIREQKFQQLVQLYGKEVQIIELPCEGLMEFVERGVLEGEEIEAYLKALLGPYLDQKIGAIVLGCTHYPFLKNSIAKISGAEVDIIDGSLGTSKELKRRLEEEGLLNDKKEKGTVEILNSLEGNKMLDLSYRLLSL